jgi:hypothetical protein
MFKALEKLVARLGKFRWIAVPLGLAVAAVSAGALWFAFALKDYSSNIRDAYEAPPGPVQHIFFAAICIALLLLVLAGVTVMVLGLRRPRGA